MKKILLLSMAFLAAFLFGCSRKKKAGPLSEWLEMHYPGRCTILETAMVDPIRNLSFKVKKSVVADKKDPELQIVLKWDARVEGLDLSKSETDRAWAQAARALQDTRTLLKAVKEVGMERASVGVYQGIAEVLIFAEPTPEQRARSLEQLQQVLTRWPAGNQYNLSVQFMEDSTYQQSFGETVPLRHWVFEDVWQQKHALVTLYAVQPYVPEPAKLSGLWKFNTNSNRMLTYIEQSEPVTQEWLEKRLKRPVRLLPAMHYSAQDDPMIVRFQYAYSFDTTSDGDVPTDGYVAGDFNTDTKTFRNLHFAKE